MPKCYTWAMISRRYTHDLVSRPARRAWCRRAIIALWAVAAIATGAASAEPLAVLPSPVEQRQAVRLVEFESLLAEVLPLEVGLCLDDLLEPSWPEADAPSPRQWQRMLAQARQAREQCAAPPVAGPDEPTRAAGTVRRAMALQVARQQALAELIARVRACAALPPAEPLPAGCRALRRPDAIAPAHWARLVHALELGRN